MMTPRRRLKPDAIAPSTQPHSICAAEGAIYDYLNLPGLRVIARPDENEFSLWVKAEQFPKLESCPTCGCDDEQFKRNGTRPRFVRDVPRGLQSVYVEILRQSYYCSQCRNGFRHLLSTVSDQRHMTTRLISYVQKLSLLRPAREVALLTGASAKTIREIMKGYMQHLDDIVRFETPRVLGLDGVFARVKDENGKSKKRECAMITDIEAGLRIDLWPSITIEEVSKRLGAFPKNKRIKIVVIDMSPALLAAIRKALPNAIIVVDLFHIQSKINEGLDKVRIRLRKGSIRKKGQLTMCRKELLRKRRDQLEPNEEKELKLWFELKPELGLAYEVVEGCLKIWYSSSSKTARERYRSWLKRLPPELRKDFEELLSAFKNWGDYIFNYFDHRFTNAFTESSNRLVKDILRETRGCGFETLRSKVIYGTWVKKQLEEARRAEMQRKKRKPQAQGTRKRQRRRRKTMGNEGEPTLAVDLITGNSLLHPTIQIELF
jgi:transposase